MKNWKALMLCIVLMEAVSVWGQTAQTEKPVSIDDMLARHVPGETWEYLPTTTIFSRALIGIGAPGGKVTIRNCEEDSSKQAWSPMDQSLRQVLDTMVQADPQYHWRVEDGVINLLPADGEPSLLKTRIHKYEVKNVTSALDALNQLMALPEVKKGMENLHLESGITPISYWSSPNPKPFSVSGREISLRQALNAIAHAQGRAIWDYVEVHCNGKDQFFIRF